MHRKVDAPRTNSAAVSNLAAGLAVKAIVPASGMLLSAVMARTLSAADFGVVALLGGYNGLFQCLAVFGADVALLREIGRRPDASGACLGSALLLTSCTSLLVAVPMYFVVHASLPSNGLGVAILLLSLSLLPVSVTKCIDAVFIARGRWARVVTMTTARETLRVILVVYALTTRGGIMAIVVAMCATALLDGLLNVLLALRQLAPMRVAVDGSLLAAFVRLSAGQVLIAALASGLSVTGVVLLSARGDHAAAAFYSAAQKCLIPLFLVLDGLGMVLLPALSRTFDAPSERRDDTLGVVARCLLGFVGLYTALGFFYAEPLVRLLFGSELVPAAALLRCLIWSVPFIGAAYVVGKLLLAGHAQRYDAIGLAAAGFVQVVVASVLIGRSGAMGMIVAAVLANIVLASLTSYFFFTRLIRPGGFSGPLLRSGGTVLLERSAERS